VHAYSVNLRKKKFWVDDYAHKLITTYGDFESKTVSEFFVSRPDLLVMEVLTAVRRLEDDFDNYRHAHCYQDYKYDQYLTDASQIFNAMKLTHNGHLLSTRNPAMLQEANTALSNAMLGVLGDQDLLAMQSLRDLQIGGSKPFYRLWSDTKVAKDELLSTISNHASELRNFVGTCNTGITPFFVPDAGGCGH
jgi:hypothetical protein